jgi:N6-L-threonylcarbamoyladenine synthase
MIILGIETSCDETAAAVVEDGVKILSNVVASSLELHTKTGGIIPEVAARQQIKFILPVIQEVIDKANIKITDINALAVTTGPGLIGSLLVGVETAKTLAYLWKKPIVPINHLVAHIYANFVSKFTNTPDFPALALVVSGGHTDLVLMKEHGKLEWLGGTRDDAAGEAFDKCARLLELPYPGGPSIASAADNHQLPTIDNQQLVKLPRPMIEEDNFDWSFSGLKTAVLKEVQKTKNGKLKMENVAALAYEIQEAITDVLVEKTLRTVKVYQPKSLLLAGGVSANQRLREKFQLAVKDLKNPSVNLFFPPVNLCTDNAASIASCTFFNYSPISWQKLEVNPNLTITS